MDLRDYYQRIRELEGKIGEEFPVVVCLVEGMANEVARGLAAKLVVDGKFRLASAGETRAYREGKVEAKRRADAATAASRVQVTAPRPRGAK